MSRAATWAIGAALGAALVIACASIIGIEERLPDDLTADGASDGDTPDQTPLDASAPNSCPAQATCADVPVGWQLASLASDGRPGCANGYGNPEDLVVAANGLGCTCKCTETTRGSCAAAGATTTFRDYPAAGCSASTVTYTLDVLDGGCANLSITTTPAVRVPTATAAPPACAADASPSLFTNGQACAAQGMACNDGGMCASALRAGERLCVMKAGDVACPPGYQAKVNAGTATSADTRACGSCTCTQGAACESPMVELFKGTGCGGTKLVVPATGSCTNADAGINYTSYRYSGKAPGCQPSVPPLLDGGVTIEDRKTLCCAIR